MLQFDLTEKPIKQFYVRKRKKGNSIYLIYRHQIYEINSFTENLWNLCTGEYTVSDIAQHLLSGNQGSSFHEVLIDVIQNILFLKEKQFITK